MLLIGIIFIFKRRDNTMAGIAQNNEDDEEVGKIAELGPPLYPELPVQEYPVELDGKRYSSLWVDHVLGAGASNSEEDASDEKLSDESMTIVRSVATDSIESTSDPTGPSIPSRLSTMDSLSEGKYGLDKI
jgi:hypothetical protein